MYYFTGVYQAVEISEAANCYFSNRNQMQQGASEFKRKWGSRSLTDNWRRGAGAAEASQFNQSGTIEETDQGSKNDNPYGLPSEESLLAKIPNTKQQKEQALKLEEEAYIKLASGYLKQLEDYKMADATLDTFDIRFPKTNKKEEELYLRYQIAMGQNKLDNAKAYSDELLKSFPDSKYAAVLRPKQEQFKAPITEGGKTVSEYYDETYSMVLNHQYADALTRIDIGKKKYDDPVFKKRFLIAEAMCYGGQANYDKADTMIAAFIRTYPADTLTPWANDVAAYIKDVRKNGAPSWVNDKYDEAPKHVKKKHVRPEKPKPEAKPLPPKPVDVPELYAYKPSEEHFGMIILPGLDSRTSALKQGITDFNLLKGLGDSVNITIDMYNIDQAVLLVRKFNDAASAKAYMDTLVTEPVFTKYKANEIKTIVISAGNYKKLFYDKKTDVYMGFYKGSYK